MNNTQCTLSLGIIFISIQLQGPYGPMVMIGKGKIKPNVGVAVGNNKIGGHTIIILLVGVMVGVEDGIGVLVNVGGTGVGGAATIASVLGIQIAVVTLPAIHA